MIKKHQFVKRPLSTNSNLTTSILEVKGIFDANDMDEVKKYCEENNLTYSQLNDVITFKGDKEALEKIKKLPGFSEENFKK